MPVARPIVIGGGRENAEMQERGFDRLIHSGFTQQEIHFLRGQFHSRRGTDVISQVWMPDNRLHSVSCLAGSFAALLHVLGETRHEITLSEAQTPDLKPFLGGGLATESKA